MEQFKKYQHNPPHLFKQNCKYFVTGATFMRQPYFNDDVTKEKLLYCLQKGFTDAGWQLEDWVILPNHYHLMADTLDSTVKITLIIKKIHQFSSIWLNKRDNMHGRKVWFNYWDSCITFESSYFARLNYIWQNPVKHGCCLNAEDYKFSSFNERYVTDRDLVDGIREKYPCDLVQVVEV
ncbi:MAG: transposase [Candidatus Cloacimonetes bacterium]|nr:transposase [Candidatus Cloacimonadota bacterium]